MKKSNTLADDGPIRLPYFDWDKAKHFYYVAKFKSLSEAAKFLNTSQPALSKKISILEYHLRCQLFTRHSRGLELTRKGEELFGIIEQSFLMLKGFSYSTAVGAEKGKKRRIRISSGHAEAAYMLDKALLAYCQANPDIILEIMTHDHLIDLSIHDVDIAISPFDPYAKGIHQDLIFTLEKKLFASEKYLQMHGEPHSLQDLIHHRIILHVPPAESSALDTNWILRIGMPQGELREPAFMTNSLENAVSAAVEGIGIMGGYSQMGIIEKSGLKMILPELVGPIEKSYIVFPAYLEKDDEIIKLKDYLIRYLKHDK